MGFGYATVSHSAGSVTSASGTVLAENLSRRYAFFQNDSDAVIYLRFDGAAALNTGLRLAVAGDAGATYEMSKALGNLNTKRVEAVTQSGTKVVLITEGT